MALKDCLCFDYATIKTYHISNRSKLSNEPFKRDSLSTSWAERLKADETAALVRGWGRGKATFTSELRLSHAIITILNKANNYRGPARPGGLRRTTFTIYAVRGAVPSLLLPITFYIPRHGSLHSPPTPYPLVTGHHSEQESINGAITDNRRATGR
ncbi:hypothetical protein J6590_005855 [Homalodisca vitripennis]|nr:hypothetical protein J6590_005855 [Homalodisca vitripennis]